MKRFDTLYLHVGTRKTGTTALQKFLDINYYLLKKTHGVLYPRAGQVLSDGYHAHHRLFNINNKSAVDSLDANIEAIIDEGLGAKCCVLSSEILADSSSFKHDLSVYKSILGLADKVKIILYLRRQDAYLESSYSQKTKLSENRDILSHKQELCLDYRSMCDRWRDLVGKENLIVRIYEREQLKEGNIFADFLEIFKIPLSDEFSLPEKVINPSLDRDALEFMRLINSLPIPRALKKGFKVPLEQRAMRLGKGQLFQDHKLLSNREKNEIIEEFRESNECVAKEYLNRADGKLFYAELPREKVEVYQGLGNDKIHEICLHLIAKVPPDTMTRIYLTLKACQKVNFLEISSRAQQLSALLSLFETECPDALCLKNRIKVLRLRFQLVRKIKKRIRRRRNYI